MLRSRQFTQAIIQEKLSVTVTHDLATWMGIFHRFHRWNLRCPKNTVKEGKKKPQKDKLPLLIEPAGDYPDLFLQF